MIIAADAALNTEVEDTTLLTPYTLCIRWARRAMFPVEEGMRKFAVATVPLNQVIDLLVRTQITSFIREIPVSRVLADHTGGPVEEIVRLGVTLTSQLSHIDLQRPSYRY